MKKIILVPAIVGLFAFAGKFTTSRISMKSDHPMAYALNAGGSILDSASVDESGNYRFQHLTAGTYDVIVKSPGKEEMKITGIEHLGNNYSYHVSIQNSDVLVMHRGPESYKDIIESDEMKVPAMSSRGDAEGMSAHRSKGAGGRASTSASYMAIERSGGSGDPSIKPGQITAGFWRDLDNWDKWIETNHESTIEAYQKEWGFYTNNRYSARFADASGKPAIGCKVQLYDKEGKKAWVSVTDNQGRVELWNNLFDKAVYAGLNTLKMEIFVGENKYDFKVSPFSGGSEEFKLPVNTKVEAIADIAFVVDATGSMGDEISYLQSELLDVATRVKKNNTCLKLNLGSVFYRDHGDEYITKKSDFSENITQVANFIFDQSAGGGGDFPEAVDDAMETAIDGLKWSENSIAKIMFLVLDAPPHETAENTAKMRKYAEKAAQKGIKIVPIVASGINQSTEFLMKYMAITTNGNYVYITDHSGIGASHEKPTGVKENMQYLNDLMVDIITENTHWEDCKTQTQNPDTNKPGTVEIATNGQWQVQVYPNPAVDHIMIKSNETPDEIGIYDLRGNEIKKVTQIAEGKNDITLGDISTGVYIVRCRKGEKIITFRILVMK